jgi:integrase
MARQLSIQIKRRPRKDGSTTFSLRVRVAGGDESVPLGNSTDGWDEIRVETARRQLLAKIELGQWTPGSPQAPAPNSDEEPTFLELATDWLRARELNPALTETTTKRDRSQLTRYLIPFFGDLRPTEISVSKIKDYREQIHVENDQIRKAAEAGKPLRDAQTGQPLRSLSNVSINMTLQMLAQILDDAEDGGWVDRNVARGRRVREPTRRRRNRGVLDVDEFLTVLEAAEQLDNRHRPRSIERAAEIRFLRDRSRLPWKTIAKRIGVAPTTAIYLYGCHENEDGTACGPRRAIVGALGLAGPRVSELCTLDNQDIHLAKARFEIRDAKTEAGIRTVDIHPALLDLIAAYRASRPRAAMDAPAFPTRKGTRQSRQNVLKHTVTPVLLRANELRASRDEPPILVHVTPHTFRRTYITFMVAAGYDLPYIQAQVGHVDPSTTLAIYAQLIRRADRDQLRAEIRQVLGVDEDTAQPATTRRPQVALPEPSATRLRAAQKAPKGPTPHL